MFTEIVRGHADLARFVDGDESDLNGLETRILISCELSPRASDVLHADSYRLLAFGDDLRF